MIHHHGTPITPRSVMNELAGEHFCVSHAAPNDLQICLVIGQSVMGDNGAFSAFTRRIVPNWNEYYMWLEPWLGPPHWAVVPDVIGGSVEDNIALAAQWPFPREYGAMVWHMHEPLEHLEFIADQGWGKIAFGSSGEYWQPGTEAWRRRVDAAWSVLFKRRLIPWVHMLRAMEEASKGPWPFASADSTNLARNHAGSAGRPTRDARLMAKRIDSKNPKNSRSKRPNQGDIFT